MIDKIVAYIARGHGVRHFLDGERVEEQCRLIGPVPIQSAAGHATRLGEPEVRDGVYSLVDEQGPS
jgi:hypothetical protein